MRILLIAPTLQTNAPMLDIPLELEQLGIGHQIIALTGVVNHERILRATASQHFDALHIASHCINNQILLSNDETLTREQLGQIARKVRVNLVFLNACDSAQLAQSLVDVGIPVVTAWTIPVLDADGIRTATFFYDELLRNNNDLHNAYRKVNPRDGSFLFLAGDGYIENLLLPLVQRLDQLSQQIARLIRVAFRQRIALALLGSLIVFICALALWLAWRPVMANVDETRLRLALTQTAEPPPPPPTAVPPTPVVPPPPPPTTGGPPGAPTPVPSRVPPVAPTATPARQIQVATLPFPSPTTVPTMTLLTTRVPTAVQPTGGPMRAPAHSVTPTLQPCY